MSSDVTATPENPDVTATGDLEELAETNHPLADGNYRIQSLGADQSVGADHATNKTQVHASSRHRHNWRVEFHYEEAIPGQPATARTYTIYEHGSHNNRVLDTTRGEENVGTPIITYPKHASCQIESHQLWRLYGRQDNFTITPINALHRRMRLGDPDDHNNRWATVQDENGTRFEQYRAFREA